MYVCVCVIKRFSTPNRALITHIEQESSKGTNIDSLSNWNRHVTGAATSEEEKKVSVELIVDNGHGRQTCLMVV